MMGMTGALSRLSLEEIKKYNKQMIYDLIILGGGPAGVSAAVYAARKRLKTLFITAEFGGQSTVSEKIYNWIGTPEIGGCGY